MEIAFGDDAKGADGGEHAAFRPVNLVHAIALSHWPALTAARQVEISREHVTGMSPIIPVSIALTAATSEVAFAGIVTVSVVIESKIVSVEHRQLPLRRATHATNHATRIISSIGPRCELLNRSLVCVGR
jgi:hypothetical protein